MRGATIAASLIREGVHPAKAKAMAAKRTGEKYKDIVKNMLRANVAWAKATPLPNCRWTMRSNIGAIRP